jgi:amino acid transporter
MKLLGPLAQQGCHRSDEASGHGDDAAETSPEESRLMSEATATTHPEDQHLRRHLGLWLSWLLYADAIVSPGGSALTFTATISRETRPPTSP